MKTLLDCIPRDTVLDGTIDFVVNLTNLDGITESEARDFLDSNVVTEGMTTLLEQSFERLEKGTAQGIYKLSETMGGGKTQSMIVSGILAKYPQLAAEYMGDLGLSNLDGVQLISFTGRSTDKVVWVEIGNELGVSFSKDTPPSEEQWKDALNGKKVLILLDEMAFYLVGVTTIGDSAEGSRFASRTCIALTNLFGAVRDFKESRNTCIVLADLEKDWEQGAEDLQKILNQNLALGGNMKSLSNEASKGAVTLSPVDNTKDELYEILRKRLFKEIKVTGAEIKEVAEAYREEADNASTILETTPAVVRDNVIATYPFHFSLRPLIDTFNDNKSFQKTRDAIKLMAMILKSLHDKGDSEVKKHKLLSLASADLNDSNVANRFVEIKPPLREALSNDIANQGKSHSERLDDSTSGLASLVARWVYAASLSEINPKGLNKETLAEYLLAPSQSLDGLEKALEGLFHECWYIEKTQGRQYYFNRHKNINAQVNAFQGHCADTDRDKMVDDKLKEMFDPKEKRCYRTAQIRPDLAKVTLQRDNCSLVVCSPGTNFQEWLEGERYKNRVVFLTPFDNTAEFEVKKRAKRFWAIQEVLKTMNDDDLQLKKAKELKHTYESELFLAIRSLYTKVHYPSLDPTTSETSLVETNLSGSYLDEEGKSVVYENSQAAKGEFVIETTLIDVSKFQVFTVGGGTDAATVYAPLKAKIEHFHFPSSGKTTWDQVLDGAATKGALQWTESKILDRAKEAFVTAGQWRELAGQLQKPPFEEETRVDVDFDRDEKTGFIQVSDFKLVHGDKLLVSEDGAEFREINKEEAFESSAMEITFKASDSTGQNQEGPPHRITNRIVLKEEFFESPQQNRKVLKVRATPDDVIVKYTIDGTDPANNGNPYDPKGIESEGGSTVKIFAEKGSVSKAESFKVPSAGEGEDEDAPEIDNEKEATLNLRSLSSKLGTRKGTHEFLTGLPTETKLGAVRCKIVDSEDAAKHVMVSWHAGAQLVPKILLEAYDYLDQQTPGGEWSLTAGEATFQTGKDLLEWCSKNNVKPEKGAVRQQ